MRREGTGGASLVRVGVLPRRKMICICLVLASVTSGSCGPVTGCASSGKGHSYKLYPGVNHFQTRQFGFVDTLTWMQTILNGESPTSNCPNLTTGQEGM